MSRRCASLRLRAPGVADEDLVAPHGMELDVEATKRSHASSGIGRTASRLVQPRHQFRHGVAEQRVQQRLLGLDVVVERARP